MIRRAYAFLLALFLLAGCGGGCQPNYPSLARQDEATKIVWYNLYGETRDPPVIEWIEQSRLNCNTDPDQDPDGFYRAQYFGGPKSPTDCVWGVTWTPVWVIQIAHPDDFNTFAYHETFAHELLHAKLYEDTGDADPNHTNVGFGTRYGHPPGGWVDQADNALLAAGL